MLRVLSFGSHVRKESDVIEFEETGIDFWFIWVNIDANRSELSSTSIFISNASGREAS